MMEMLDPEQDEFCDLEFKKLEARETRFQGKFFNRCTFIKCNFNGTVFQNCRFRDCVFKNCDLSLVNLKGSSFSNTSFEDSILIGIDWTLSSWGTGKIFFKQVDFSGCVLNYSSFMGLNLKKVTMKKCIAHEMGFQESDLTQANLTLSDLKDSRFAHTNLTETDLRGARDYQIDPTQNTLKKTRFSMPEVMSLLYCLDIEIADISEERESA